MKILTVVPTQGEFDAFLEACQDQGYHAEAVATGRLLVTYFPGLETAVAIGGLGKTQFALQTQHLIDAGHWDVVICAGAAGALAVGLAVGDVVIATETVEHDIRNKFGPPLLPRFSSSEQILRHCHRALRTDPAFRVHYGPIASGDEDVVEPERRAAIHKRTNALAVAWEGAGGARASQFSGVAFIEIRGVTDNANSAAAFDFELNMKKAMKSVTQVVIGLACWGLEGY